VGQVGNLDHEKRVAREGRPVAMAGQAPHVRGVAMNPVDHPLGGGREDLRRPAPGVAVGHADQGFKTRNRKATDQFIITRRPK